MRSKGSKGGGIGVLVPRDAGREAGAGGEVGVVGVVRFLHNSSPELMSAADGGGRGCRRRPGGGNKRVSCQEDAQDQTKAQYGKKEAWRGSRRPGLLISAGGCGGAPGSFWAALWLWGWGTGRKWRGGMLGIL